MWMFILPLLSPDEQQVVFDKVMETVHRERPLLGTWTADQEARRYL